MEREHQEAGKGNVSEPIPGIPWRTFDMSHANGFKAFAEGEGYHPLDIDSCYHKREIAKMVVRDSYVFLVAKIARFDPRTNKLYFDDFDMFIRPDSLVTVEENPGTLAEEVRHDFPRTNDPHANDANHLVFAILDEIVDDYLTALDHLGEAIGTLETRVWKKPTPETLEKIFTIRRSLIEFRRNASSMRELVSAIVREPRVKTNGDLETYYRDLYEHIIRVSEFIETYRDVLNGTLDVYVSALAQRTNEISKVLALYGTIALPFIVVTGMYGMNIPLPFQRSEHAFVYVFIAMAMLAVVALWHFKRNRWF